MSQLNEATSSKKTINRKVLIIGGSAVVLIAAVVVFYKIGASPVVEIAEEVAKAAKTV